MTLGYALKAIMLTSVIVAGLDVMALIVTWCTGSGAIWLIATVALGLTWARIVHNVTRCWLIDVRYRMWLR